MRSVITRRVSRIERACPIGKVKLPNRKRALQEAKRMRQAHPNEIADYNAYRCEYRCCRAWHTGRTRTLRETQTDMRAEA